MILIKLYISLFLNLFKYNTNFININFILNETF